MLVCLIGLCTLLVDRKWDDDKAFEMLSLALLCILRYVHYVMVLQRELTRDKFIPNLYISFAKRLEKNRNLYFK